MKTRKKSIKILLAVILFLIIPFSYSHAATTVTLDGIANAGWWANDLSSSYLNVRNTADSSYYYQWRYGSAEELEWDNMDELVADLNTQGFSWWLESGGDPFANTPDPIWTSLYLEAGSYVISLAPDSAAYNLQAYWQNNQWNAYVQMLTDSGGSYNFGEGTYAFDSEEDTLQYYNENVGGIALSLNEGTNINFYINDTNSIDNSGSVKLNIAVVPEPGQVLLFITGAVTLLCFRLKKRGQLAASTYR